jgi:hypothetical protein
MQEKTNACVTRTEDGSFRARVMYGVTLATVVIVKCVHQILNLTSLTQEQFKRKFYFLYIRNIF